MGEEDMKVVKKMLNDDSVSFNEFYDFLRDKDWGFWDGVNNEDIIKMYVNEMAGKGVKVSHILSAIEKNPSKEELYAIWLGNSMLTPKPINTKKDLFNALFK